jgi:succinate dehydrogenase / fumarate reductase membrane anchor subunit
LVASVVYHALNGLRIALFDWNPHWWRRQADAAKLVFLGTAVILVPVFLIMAGHIVTYYNERVFGAGKSFELGLDQVVESVLPFAVGGLVVVGAGFVLSALVSLLPRTNGQKVNPGRRKFDTFMWSFMRYSGVAIIPLVFGHLAMVHVINGVFDITKPGHTPIFTNLGPNVVEEGMLAANFVRLRWNTMLAGVYIWRIYDAALLSLIVLHGFNGLRYVINDYFSNKLVNRALSLASFATMIGLIVVGGAAIIMTAPATTQEMLAQAARLVP